MQNVPDDEQDAKLQAAICRYLAGHPHAADTVRGIARYWTDIGETPATKPSLDAVQCALDALVAQGRIVVTALVDGARIYQSAGAPPHDAARRECSGRNS